MLPINAVCPLGSSAENVGHRSHADRPLLGGRPSFYYNVPWHFSSAVPWGRPQAGRGGTAPRPPIFGDFRKGRGKEKKEEKGSAPAAVAVLLELKRESEICLTLPVPVHVLLDQATGVAEDRIHVNFDRCIQCGFK